MKTYSKFLNCFASLLVIACVFSSFDALAGNQSVVIPSEEIKMGNLEAEMPPPSLQIVSVVALEYTGGVHIRCHGTNTGRATVEVQGGIAPYTYQWSGLPNQTGATAVGMQAGTYTVTVTDAAGTSVSALVTLLQNPPLQVMANVDPILCHGGVASITLSATGGTPSYSGLNWYQVTAGTHSFIVADANGCRKKTTIEITEPPVLLASSTASSILCNGGTADVLVEATGGVGPYNGTGQFTAQAGNSSYVITDANGCYAYTDVLIDEPAVLTTNVSHTDILCRGGEAEVTVDGVGGTPPYVGTGSYTVMAGTYQYIITDANGCQSSSSVSLTQPSALIATISNTPVLCNGDLSAVEVLATGGTTPYIGTGTYYVAAGMHSYTVVDDNGCSVEIATMITQPRAIDVTATWTPGQYEGSPAIVDVVAAGGTPAYSGTGTFPEAPGTHTYTVYDANGCSGSGSVTIPAQGTFSMGTAPTVENGNVFLKGKSTNTCVQASFNGSTKRNEIIFKLDYDSRVRVDIYDLAGTLVQRIEQAEALKDQHYRITVPSTEWSNGVYVYHFHTDMEEIVDKLQVVK